ncbi:MAG: phage head morphogenesis protein [Firmicutes bacterium]|nr:phage head morphogenesis protein [Bacillota bacterium]
MRTEVHRARELGKIESLEHAFEQGFNMTKVWDSALDDRTRESHQELDGQEVPMFDDDGSPGLFVSPETRPNTPAVSG